MSNDLFWSYVIGFIDGDGSIFWSSKRLYLAIKCHSSWLKILGTIGRKLHSSLRVHIGTKGYAELKTSRKSVLDFLYDRVREFDLPVLERKWNLVQKRKEN